VDLSRNCGVELFFPREELPDAVAVEHKQRDYTAHLEDINGATRSNCFARNEASKHT